MTASQDAGRSPAAAESFDRPFAWERSYPPGVSWDAPIRTFTLGALIDEAVAAHGPRPAIEFRGRTTTFDDLGRTVERAAAAFLRAGIGPGTTTALYLPNTLYHPIGFFGGAKAGTRLVHLSPLDPERVLAHKLADAGARTLLTTNLAPLLPNALKLLAAGHLDRVVVGEDEALGPGEAPALPIPEGPGVIPLRAFLDGATPPAAWPRIDVESTALLQYTGGTTGLPKGAVISHANLTAAVSMYEAWFAGQRLSRPGEDRVIGVLPLFHIYALTTVLLRHLLCGNAILLRARFGVKAVLDDIRINRATAFPGVPTMWIALANHPGIEDCDFSRMTYCGSGGASLPIEVAERFERITGQRLGGGWGMTETSPAGTNNPQSIPSKPGSIGLPLPGVVLQVVSLDDPARVLPVGEVGEIRIAGRNVFSGYWNRPQETRDAFVDGFFLTGDVGRMDEDGFFFIVDRKKDMIVSSGFNVYPQTIEQAIYEHPAVDECVVVGVPDDYRGEAAKAFVTLRPGATLAYDDLVAFLADKVGRHEMPVGLDIRDALPRTPVGKLSKTELREEERRRHAAGRTSAPPTRSRA